MSFVRTHIAHAPSRRAVWLQALCVLTLTSCTLLASGCDEDEDLPGERGDLGEGNFVYRCLGVNDSACASGTAVLPQVMAVGGRFDMSFAVASGPLPAVISPASELVRRENGAFEVLQGGLFALLAVTGNSEVIDIKHLAAAPIAEVRVQRDKELPVARLSLLPGESATVGAVPFDAQGVTLGGALSYVWRSNNEALVSVESLPQLNKVRIRGNAVGAAALIVDVAGKSFSVAVEVGSRDAGLSDAGQADAAIDAGVDAGDDVAMLDATGPAQAGDAATPDAATPDAATPDAAGGGAT
jgi:hypothetical protein